MTTLTSTSQPRPVPSAQERLLHLLAEGPALEAFLEEAVRLAADGVPHADACGMTLSRDRRAFTVAHSHEFAAEVDEMQYGANEGPCLDALRTGHLVEVNDLANDPRWPRYRPHAVEHGVVASMSCPLNVDGQTVAVLNLYARRQQAFTADDRQHAQILAAQCSAALTVMLRHVDQVLTQQQLAEAMQARGVIDQALGILMAQQGCSADEAFDLLRAASSARNRKLREIAAELIEKITGKPPQPPAPFHER